MDTLDFAFDFDGEPGIVVARLRTPWPTFESCLQAMSGLAKHPRLEAGCGLLAELLDMEYVPSFDEAKELAEFGHLAGLLAGHRMAYAIRPKHLSAAYVFEATAELLGTPVGVFETFEEARDWLLEPAPSGTGALDP